MKTLQAVACAIALITLFSSCQPTSSQTSDLANAQTRNEIMKAIATDSVMSNEMIRSMMNNKNGMMIMQNHQQMTMENHTSMMNMLETNPDMMQNMMAAMMETAKGDTIMMSGMIKSMMENPQMMEMMQKRIGNSKMNDRKHM